MPHPVLAGAHPARCVVCAAALPRSFSALPQAQVPYPVCQAVACRMVVSRRDEMGEPGFRHYLQTQARHTQSQAARTRAARERQLAQVQENENAWLALRARLPAGLAREPLKLLLPSGPPRASRLAAQRRERYRAHLLKVIAEAEGIAGAAPPALAAAGAAGASAMPARLCGLCRGGCCTHGGNEAYLSAATMRRFMDAQPQLSRDQVAAAYLERVSDKTQTGSCINHTAHGCSLPTDMRSDICNRFSCESLARLQAAQRGPETVHTVLIVRRKQDHWRRAQPGLCNAINAFALLDEYGVRRFSQRALQATATGASWTSEAVTEATTHNEGFK